MLPPPMVGEAPWSGSCVPCLSSSLSPFPASLFTCLTLRLRLSLPDAPRASTEGTQPTSAERRGRLLAGLPTSILVLTLHVGLAPHSLDSDGLPFFLSFRHASGPLHGLCFLPGTLFPLPCQSCRADSSLSSQFEPHPFVNIFPERPSNPLTTHSSPYPSFVFVQPSLSGNSSLGDVTLGHHSMRQGHVCPGRRCIPVLGSQEYVKGRPERVPRPRQCPGMAVAMLLAA